LITRYSSRRRRLGDLLPNLLAGARGYDRIAGYFSSSILEVAGEALDTMAGGSCVRIICNSELHPLDVGTARAAKAAMYREWCRSLPNDVSPAFRTRLDRLYGFLVSGRLRVRVLPDKRFGFVHGKAGVVTRPDDGRIAFMGSANESRRAWTLNYEIVWTDDSEEGIRWVQEEFDALWGDPAAVDLADAVVQDVVRLVRRVVIPGIGDWKAREDGDPAAAAVELPVYRRENGLWAHQKYFVRLAFDLHKRGGARLVLADQVGLGKTVQLALAAKLMALWGGGKVLIVAPKTLLLQWQDELWDLLRLPSAVWTGRAWEDEQGVVHPRGGVEGLRQCPRRVGLVSSGLIIHNAEAAGVLVGLRYECVVLDEAHHARRHNLGPGNRNDKAAPKRLLRFLREIAASTKSLLLATATPVQIDPIEAWDLLDALNMGNDTVLGRTYGRWELEPRLGLDYVLGCEDPPTDTHTAWEWIRDPLPPAEEDRVFDLIRRGLRLPADQSWAPPEALDALRPPDRKRVADLGNIFFQQHNPYIRHIVRRTRDYLESTIDPQTNEPYLQPVRVRLFGEAEKDAVILPAHIHDAYEAAETFCKEVGERPGLNSGFLKTMLLRRVGSTIEAGRKTALVMLGPTGDEGDGDEDDVDDAPRSSLYPLTVGERAKLELFLDLLKAAGSADDPKYRDVERILLQGVEGTVPWLDRGCIIFSQYYDSAFWVAGRLSRKLPDEPIALYAGAARSGLFRDGLFTRHDREVLKDGVRRGETRLLVGTDAASEGLNLQMVGTLINLDLPWNPTRLEQRKGRIQRIGQVQDEVYLYNMRYRDSVEDRVHQLLSTRLRAIRDLFGQLPDTLEDAWVEVALKDEERAREIIDQVPTVHPFEMRYDRHVETVDWESCSKVLDSRSQLDVLMEGW